MHYCKTTSTLHKISSWLDKWRMRVLARSLQTSCECGEPDTRRQGVHGSTSSCLVASSFLSISVSFVRRLLKCMSLNIVIRFAVTSLTDWKRNKTIHLRKLQKQKCIKNWIWNIPNYQNNQLLFFRVVSDVKSSDRFFKVFMRWVFCTPIQKKKKKTPVKLLYVPHTQICTIASQFKVWNKRQTKNPLKYLKDMNLHLS